jgi:DNA-binding NarL/FixJ family response regulator
MTAPTQLVGRVREVAELELALDRLAAGSPWSLQIVGEPGIGKSRLLAELSQRAQARGYLVLRGRAAEFELDVPFGVLLDAFNDYFGSLEPSFVQSLGAETLSELATIFPSLAGSVDSFPAPRLQAERYRVHYAIQSVLERLAERRPIVVILDDVQWADAASVEMISHAIRRFHGPVMGAFAFRYPPTGLARPFEAAARDGVGGRLELAPLTEEQAQSLMDPALDPELRQTLYHESGGNPFYLEELLRSGHASAPRSALASEDSGEGWSPPPAVAAAIREELAVLSPDARQTANAAAVAGESFVPSLVAYVAELAEPTVVTSLDDLLAADLVRPTESARYFRFRHPIVRRAVYDSTPRAWQLGAHARTAQALAGLHRPASAFAHHVERSATPGDEDAIAVLVDAAHEVAHHAPLTAGGWLLAASRLLPPNADDRRRLGLLDEATSALASAGAYAASIDALEQARALVPDDEPAARAEFVAKIASAKRRTGGPLESRELLVEALETLDESDHDAMTALLVEIAFSDYWRGDFAHARRLAQAVVVGGGADQLTTFVAAMLGTLSNCSEGRVTEAFASLDEAQAAFALLPDARLVESIDSIQGLASAALRLERVDDTLDHLQRGFVLARASGQGAMIPGWLAFEAFALLMKGRLAEAGKTAETAVEAALLSGSDWHLAYAFEADSMAAYWAGDAQRALTSAQDALTCADRISATIPRSRSRVQLAGAWYAAGDAQRACIELDALDVERTRLVLDLHAAHGWELAVRAHLALGDLDAAEDISTRSQARADATPLEQQQATTRCTRAAVLLASDDAPAALAVIDAAAHIAARVDNPFLRARVQALHGVALAAMGKPAPAIAELEAAENVLFECGSFREADAAARELRRLGRRVTRRTRPRERGTGLSALSPREREVADQVASGKTNRNVAETLFLSEKTVETHLARIYDKLGVRSRTALTAIITRGGASAPAGSLDR